jgi:hypothetical protein
MRRLYSTFAGGVPGAGLLLLRVVLGATLVVRPGWALRGHYALEFSALPEAALAVMGLLIVPGLWTPVAGAMVVPVAMWQVLTAADDPWVALVVATIGAAVAMLGPGRWSVDAHLYGWRRVSPLSREPLRGSKAR